MSAPEPSTGEQIEFGSKIKVTRNAKGDPQWEISVREGVTEAEMDRLREIAVAQHHALERRLVTS